MSRIKQFYNNATKHHSSLSKEQVLSIVRKIRMEMKMLDDVIPNGCHIVSPSWLNEWNENKWMDVSSLKTNWHYAYLKKKQAIIFDAEHSNNMSDNAHRPTEAIERFTHQILELEARINNVYLNR